MYIPYIYEVQFYTKNYDSTAIVRLYSRPTRTADFAHM